MDAYRHYSKFANQQTERCLLRGLFDINHDKCNPIPLEEVEPASEIVKRFNTGAMSYGSISLETNGIIFFRIICHVCSGGEKYSYNKLL